MTGELAISLEGVSKTYHLYKRPEDRLKQLLLGRFGAHYNQSYQALEDIDLEMRRGETVGLIGRNGAGKSTLLQIVCGTLTPTTGEIMVRGRVAAMIELGAGFNPEFTGRENVRLSATVAGLTKREIEQRLPSIVEFAGIGDFIDQPVKLYSSGMYARLAFAVAAHVDADILVVDEILSVGDAAFGQKCQRFINEFKKRGTLMFVSHDVGTIINLCDRAIWLERGRIRASGPAKEITQRYLTASSEEKDGGEAFNVGRARGQRPAPTPKPLEQARDFRENSCGKPAFHSEIAVSEFDAQASWSGLGGASMTSVAFLDADGKPCLRFTGGAMVKLAMRGRAHADLHRALIGFQILDDRGQLVLGANTNQAYRDRPVPVAPGQEFEVVFDMQMPHLRSGAYSVTVAISDGTQADKVHHQWMYDVISLMVVASGSIRGITGVQMRSIDTVRHEAIDRPVAAQG